LLKQRVIEQRMKRLQEINQTIEHLQNEIQRHTASYESLPSKRLQYKSNVSYKFEKKQPHNSSQQIVTSSPSDDTKLEFAATTTTATKTTTEELVDLLNSIKPGNNA
jgi:anti-sigma-K factor RskA